MNRSQAEDSYKLLFFTLGIDGRLDQREDDFLRLYSKVLGQQIDFDPQSIMRELSIKLSSPSSANVELNNILENLASMSHHEKEDIAKMVIHMTGVDWDVDDREINLLQRIENAWGIDVRSLVDDS